MKERGILFSATMVRAILAGSKTQTRGEGFGEVADALDALARAIVPGMEAVKSARIRSRGAR